MIYSAVNVFKSACECAYYVVRVIGAIVQIKTSAKTVQKMVHVYKYNVLVLVLSKIKNKI